MKFEVEGKTSALFVRILLLVCVNGLSDVPAQPVGKITPQPVVSASNRYSQAASADWLQYGHHRDWEHPFSLDAGWALKKRWNIEVGGGRSQIIGQGKTIYVCIGVSKKGVENTELVHRTLALDAESGETKWSTEHVSTKRPGQENFSGTPIGPQSTPVIVKNRLITLSFTGQLTCLDRTDGSNVWRKDLVADLGASPVQFGFSASPIVDHSSPDRVYVMGAGKSGGFYCLRVADGSTIWKAACDSFSYATPTDANFGNVEQWIVVSENESLGIAKSDGSRLWRFPMPSPGLTNVPTPLVVNESRLLISGQGCKGTRCLEINNQNGKWSVSQKWFLPQIEYFYGNWLRWSDDIVIGCTEAYLAAIDVAQGTVLGRYRGYGKGNVSRTRDQLIVVNGEGKLSLLTPNTVQSETSGFDVVGEFNLIQARCWTPLSYVDGRLFLRGDGRIICMEKTRENDQLAIPNQLTESKPLTFISQPADRSTADPVEEIFAMFQRQGQGAALRLYSKLRSANALSESARIELAEAAFDQGLPEVAKMILSHAAADFPNSRDIKQATKRLSGK